MCTFAGCPKGQIEELPIKVTCGDTLIKTTTEGAGAHSTVTSRRQLSGDQVAMEGQSGKVKRPLILPLFSFGIAERRKTKDDGDEGPSWPCTFPRVPPPSTPISVAIANPKFSP